MDDTLLSQMVTLNSAYTYYPTYGEVLAQYNARATWPVVMVEGYFHENNSSNSLTPPSLNALGFRRQAYWTAFSGGIGGFFHGNQLELSLTSPLPGNWQSPLDTVTAKQMKYFASFINSFMWWNLSPDQTHVVVTSGYR